MKKLYDEIEDDICGLYNYTFEPTINLFKNALVFNYKKVGTRFFREIVSYPHNINKQNKQLDLSFRPRQFNQLLNDGLLPKEFQKKAIAYGSRMALEYLANYHFKP